MPKTNSIELPDCEPIPILYEDRSVIAVDKPRGWMLVPHSWQKTNWNLQAAITSSIAARDFWARSRSLKFLRHIHRLDADTTGILLFGKSPGAVETFSDLFEGRKMEKTYLAIVVDLSGNTLKGGHRTEWTSRLKLAPDPRQPGRMMVDTRHGKESETHFKVLETAGKFTLVEAKPVTGRTHQIRIHLLESSLPIVGDELYGKREGKLPLGLRAIRLAYTDPFTRKRVEISAPVERFLKEFGFIAPTPGWGTRPT
ncbi:MAG TPA: RluA family pseudouridine synthase [Verrucomicrobiae bacterium]|nr:RluA family pseudouridine synthase [Verrucomicrobiae bacterium]